MTNKLIRPSNMPEGTPGSGKTEIILDKKEIAEANWYKFDNLPYVPPTTSLSGILINSFVEDHS